MHVTLHLALRDVFEQLTTEAVLAKCHLADAAMRRLNAVRPRIGVCALNPHAGEQGLFGQEERETIAPAVASGQASMSSSWTYHPVSIRACGSQNGGSRFHPASVGKELHSHENTSAFTIAPGRTTKQRKTAKRRGRQSDDGVISLQTP